MSVTEFLRKADFALEAAKRDLGAGDFDGAANRLYYAMFHFRENREASVCPCVVTPQLEPRRPRTA